MTIREAVSAVFSYEDTFFMIIRQPYLPAFPGYHAFPGGKIDRGESDTAIQLPHLSQFPARQMHALHREMEEELGFDLKSACQSGLVTSIHHLCDATTPPFEKYRFCNHFFRINLSSLPTFEVDTQEAMSAGWFTPGQLIKQLQAGKLLAVPPIQAMFHGLHGNPQATFLDNIEFTYDEENGVPVMESLPDFYILPVRSNTLPPARFTNAFLVGGILADPSPKDDEEMQRLLHTLQDFQLKGILLTHHHPDHHERAPQIAQKLSLPLYMSAYTHQRILHFRPNYFDGLQIHLIKDGDRLTTWHDQDVLVHEVPGHDEGQLALAPQNLNWFIVGDLIQGIGTVVISRPEGNMTKYFQTLEKVIALDPGIIIPSHGVPMGTTYRLRATLKHRKKREASVRKLHQEGKTPQEIREHIYPDLDARLIPFAQENVHTHLEKIQAET